MEGFNGNGVMGFADGDGNGGLSPLMIMPLMASHPSGVDQNPFFIPPPNHGHARSFKNDGNDNEAEKNRSDVKAKIMCHPHYPRLLCAYINCHKVEDFDEILGLGFSLSPSTPMSGSWSFSWMGLQLGAPPEVVARMGEICGGGGGGESCRLGEDPALDQFMEAYCEMLMKYEEELSKPFKEAMIFLSRMETQFKSLTLSSSSSLQDPPTGGGKGEMPGSSSEDGGDMASEAYVDPHAEDRELKGQLLRKYSGYLGGLKQEFLKRRKKGKLPKEARFQLLDWWNRHYKWPYPSESQKLALAESTGLDQKQINNWFINQRKRHWKPAEEMQFAAVAAAAAAAGVPQPAEIGRAHYYLDNAFSVGGFGGPFSDLPRPF